MRHVQTEQQILPSKYGWKSTKNDTPYFQCCQFLEIDPFGNTAHTVDMSHKYEPFEMQISCQLSAFWVKFMRGDQNFPLLNQSFNFAMEDEDIEVSMTWHHGGVLFWWLMTWSLALFIGYEKAESLKNLNSGC